MCRYILVMAFKPICFRILQGGSTPVLSRPPPSQLSGVAFDLHFVGEEMSREGENFVRIFSFRACCFLLLLIWIELSLLCESVSVIVIEYIGMLTAKFSLLSFL